MNQTKADKGNMNPPAPKSLPRQRALVLQGGGALGAYEAGVYKVLYEWISKQINNDENVFDVIAGTSIGAINGAILVSHVIEKQKESPGSLNIRKRWEGSADILEEFWNSTRTRYFFTNWMDLGYWGWDVSRNVSKMMRKNWEALLEQTEATDFVQNNQLLKEWYSYLHFATEAWDIPASGEAARRYWSTRLPFPSPLLGAPNVASAIPRFDFKFWDNPAAFTFRGSQERLPLYYFNPSYSLQETLRGFVNFPIKTEYKDGKKQPRLVLVTLDIQSGDTVAFDSYSESTAYGNSDIEDEKEEGETNKISSEQESNKFLIRYPNGLEWNHLKASFSMPGLYRYATLIDENSKQRRTYWDGGQSSNTPLRELIRWHKDYWQNFIKNEMNEHEWDGEKGVKIPALDVYIVDLWPSKLKDIQGNLVPSDNDFVKSRKIDFLLLDKTEYDETVSIQVTDYINLAEELIQSYPQKEGAAKVAEILDKKATKSTFGKTEEKKNRELLKGHFDIERVLRIERKDDGNSNSYELSDFSVPTISSLFDQGKFDALDQLVIYLASVVKGNKLEQGIQRELSSYLDEARRALENKRPDYYHDVWISLNNFIRTVREDKKSDKKHMDLLMP